jgi:TonB family protein
MGQKLSTRTIHVDAITEVDGLLTNLRITKSPGSGLDKSILETLKTWKCTPVKVNGKPVRASVPIEVSFRMFGW